MHNNEKDKKNKKKMHLCDKYAIKFIESIFFKIIFSLLKDLPSPLNERFNSIRNRLLNRNEAQLFD